MFEQRRLRPGNGRGRPFQFSLTQCNHPQQIMRGRAGIALLQPHQTVRQLSLSMPRREHLLGDGGEVKRLRFAQFAPRLHGTDAVIDRQSALGPQLQNPRVPRLAGPSGVFFERRKRGSQCDAIELTARLRRPGGCGSQVMLNRFTMKMQDELAHLLALRLVQSLDLCAALRLPLQQGLPQRDGALPVALGLRDFQTTQARTRGHGAAVQGTETRLGAVQQARLQVILTKLEARLITDCGRQIHAPGEMFMDPDRAIGFTTASKQITERKMKLGRLGVKTNHVDEGADGAFGLLIQKKIQATKISIGQTPSVLDLFAQISPGSEPA